MACSLHAALMVFLMAVVAAVGVYGYIAILFEVMVRSQQMEAMVLGMQAEELLVELPCIFGIT